MCPTNHLAAFGRSALLDEAASSHHAERAHFLIVDDISSMRRVIGCLLKDQLRNVRISEATDGENALLVAPDDPEALASAINRVLGDGDLRERLRAGGLHLVAAHGTDVMVDAYLRLYDRVISSRPAQRRQAPPKRLQP